MPNICKINGSILVTFVLDEELATLMPIDAIENTYIMCPLGLILLLIGGLLFSYVFGNMINSWYLLHLKDLKMRRTLNFESG